MILTGGLRYSLKVSVLWKNVIDVSRGEGGAGGGGLKVVLYRRANDLPRGIGGLEENVAWVWRYEWGRMGIGEFE